MKCKLARRLRTPIGTIVVFAALGLFGGCGGGGDTSATSENQGSGSSDEIRSTPGPSLRGTAPVAPVCAGAPLSTLQTRIYVAPLGVDSDSCGTATSNACATPTHAVERCVTVGGVCGVLVRWGRYTLTQTLALRPGVGVYGGCRFDGEADQRYRSTLLGPSDKPAVSAVSITQPTAFVGFQVLAGPARTLGGASIAMLVRDSSALQVVGAQLVGGIGGDGADGGNGAMGANGGSAGGTSLRTAGTSSGAGVGGTGGGSSDACTPIAASSGGTVGRFGLGGNASGASSNGVFCGDRPVDYPGDAADGALGANGSTGAAVSVSNQVTGTLGADGRWTAGKGLDGFAGSDGSGGGGGGRGGGCADSINQYPGGDGGGGGGGGGAGAGGGGGGHGGGSFALLLVNSTLGADGASLVPGVGGNGGRGGNGAPGGAAGAGSTGEKFANGRNTFWGHLCPGLGGNGGNGGAGGGGSPGAAGNGGPATALATLGTSSVPTGLAQTYLGAAGTAGASGVGGVKGWWRKIADEGGPVPPTTGWVRFGADSRWLTLWRNGGALTCDITTFGGDPAYRTVKRCEVIDPAGVIAGEGGTFNITETTVVTYGSSSGSTSKTVAPGTATCDTTFFGSDPSYGYVKQCTTPNVQAGAAGAAAPGANARIVDFNLPASSTLYAGQSLPIGGVLTSAGGGFRLVMQGDNNLALYTASGGYRWDANTPSTGANRLLMRDDGSAAIVDAQNHVHWSSTTQGHPGAYLRVGDDGKVAIVESGSVLWSTP